MMKNIHKYLSVIILILIATIYAYIHFSWQKYTHPVYNYSVHFPKEWIIDPDKSLIDDVNNTYSIINMYKPDMSNSASIQVSAYNVVEKLVKDAYKTESIQIAHTSVTAYFFKSEYNDCAPETNDYCVYFLIPIQYGNIWYILGGDGSVNTSIKKSIKVIKSFTVTSSDTVDTNKTTLN